MYFLKFLSNFIEKSWNDALKMPSNSLPDADLNLPEMKTKSPSCPAGGVRMYVIFVLYFDFIVYNVLKFWYIHNIYVTPIRILFHLESKIDVIRKYLIIFSWVKIKK